MADDETYIYPDPVAQLLTYGKSGLFDEKWFDYGERGLRAEHIPDLIRMATDEELNHGDEDDPATWAPVHAWRALGQLRAEAAVEPLFALFELVDLWHEWVIDELPEVYGLIGGAALPALAAYMANREHEEWPRIIALLSVKKIGEVSPAARAESIAILSKQLESFQKDGEYDLNASLVSALVDFDAKEAAPLMERAFQANAVDIVLRGDWEDIQEEWGLLSPEQLQARQERREAEERQREEAYKRMMQKRDVPSFEIVGATPEGISVTPSDSYWRQTPRISAQQKTKHKSKVSKQSRKKNRKR